jgi:hypothetical protein
LASFSPISPDEVKALIRQSPCSSCLLDPIPTRLLRKVASVMARPISSIINLSLSSGVFPGQLKSAVITPLLKKSLVSTLSSSVTTDLFPTLLSLLN